MRARHRVVKKLLWLAQPKTFDLARELFRDEDIRRQIYQRRFPTGKEPVRAAQAERQQALFGRQPMIVERVQPVRDENMIAEESGYGFDPSGTEAEVRISLEKRVSEHLTGAVGEELAVGPMPSPDRIILDVDLREEHRARDPRRRNAMIRRYHELALWSGPTTSNVCAT